MKSLSTIVPAVLLSGALMLLALVLLLKPFTTANAYGALSTAISSATSSSAISVTTSTRILATTTALGVGFTRVYTAICNTTAATPVFISLNRDIPVNVGAGTGGISIAGGQCYEITDRNAYQGSIQASSSAGAAVITVNDYVQ